MSDARIPKAGAVPKLGRVNELCQEWMVREDGAIAYQLQNQEIRQHYSGNKQRNALVREDFPKAKTEQQKEQELAEQAAAVYRRMLEEQEEVDRVLAERLTKKLELEERMKKGVEERESLHAAKRLQDDFVKPPVLRQLKPAQESFIQSGSSMSRSGRPYRPEDVESTNIELGPYMELPLTEQISSIYNEPYVESYSEPYSESNNQAQQSQEEADAELARMLQEQEGNLEECIMQRDRLLAIEAQDKELAKVLQERERIKAKKAKERAKQKALAKKQQKRLEEPIATDVIMPDDAYSVPADMISAQTRNAIPHLPPPNNGVPQSYEEFEDNYSLPVDRVESTRPIPQSGLTDYPNYTANREDPPVRPSHLGIRPVYKARYPDPEDLGKPHHNIAIAIDPTYPKQDVAQSPSSYLQHISPAKSVSSKSSSRSSPSSSSKEIDARLEMTNAPPYMPIQGQKRTASLEKRRVRDGCKQQ